MGFTLRLFLYFCLQQEHCWGFFLLLNDNSGSVGVNFFKATIIAAVVFAISKTLQLNIFKQNNLSDIYPLASLSPLTLYFFGIVFLNEQIKNTALLGIIIMVIGIYMINFKSNKNDLLHPFKEILKNRFAMLFLVAIILSNITAIAEKSAINDTLGGNIYFLIFFENLFLTIIMLFYVIRTNKNWIIEIKAHFSNLLIAGIIYSALSLLVMNGFKNGPIALVATVKKLEVVVVLIISYLFFKERTTKLVYLGTLLTLISIYLIKI